jgi:hypothetical protein
MVGAPERVSSVCAISSNRCSAGLREAAQIARRGIVPDAFDCHWLQENSRGFRLQAEGHPAESIFRLKPEATTLVNRRLRQ